MTRAELDAIRERLAAAKAWRPFDGSWDDIAFGQRAAQDVEALLAEVERLRDALLDIARGEYADCEPLVTPEQRAQAALDEGKR